MGPVCERSEEASAKSKEEEKKDGKMDIGELDTSIEEDVWEGLGEYEADGALEDHGGLDPRAVTEARSEEIAFLEQIGVWEAATMDECRKMTGRELTRAAKEQLTYEAG